MAIYYLSACHDCKEKVIWSKVSQEQAEMWHINFHNDHNTVFGHDLDDEFYDSIWKYKDLGIQDGK
jgi:hypothetical protein